MIDDASESGVWAEFIARRAEQGYCVNCGASDIHPEVAQCQNDECPIKQIALSAPITD